MKRKRLIQMLAERSFMYSEEPTFRLASGRLSRYYINCKPTTMDPEGLFLVGHLLFEKVKNMGITAAGGLTMGADPLAYALAYTSHTKGCPIKAFVVRKEPKDHGTGNLIEGPVEPGERVAILEDVITTGGSTLKAIRAAEEFGLKVMGVVALVDREEGGKQRIEELGYPVKPLILKSEIFETFEKKR